MPSLNEECKESFQCEIRSGENAICRVPPGLCKCQDGFFIEQRNENTSASCVKRTEIYSTYEFVLCVHIQIGEEEEEEFALTVNI